jgi:O-antigen/teichoic acid export membrane protein
MLAPAAQHLDRFIIAARLSAEAAALYATPFDLVIRIAVLAQAVLAGAFPALSAALATDDGAAGRLFRHATLAILALVLPPALACLLFADLLLVGWLGADFARHATPAARWLAAGVVLFALDGVAAALIDGAARAARNAALAIAELAVYLPILLLALATHGIAGAAAAWALRMLLAAACRLILAQGAHPRLAPELRALGPALAATLAVLAVALLAADQAPLLRLALFPALLAPVALLAWQRGLPPGERAALYATIGGRVALLRRKR